MWRRGRVPSVLSRRPGTGYFHFNRSHGPPPEEIPFSDSPASPSVSGYPIFPAQHQPPPVRSTPRSAAPGSHLLTAPARPPQGGSNAAAAAAGSSAPGRRGTLSLLRAAARTGTPQPFSTAALPTDDPASPPSRLRAPPSPHFYPAADEATPLPSFLPSRRRSPRLSPHDAAPR